MGESLISIACIHEISSSVLSSLLVTAYRVARDLDSPDTLLLLTENSKESIHQYTWDSVTRPPIETSFTSPFMGWNPFEVAKFLLDTAEGSLVDTEVFLLADEMTEQDGTTLLLVQIKTEKQGHCPFNPDTMRVAAEFLNTEAVAVSITSKDVGELVTLVDDDGVYRGGRDRFERPPEKGGEAPKKQVIFPDPLPTCDGYIDTAMFWNLECPLESFLILYAHRSLLRVRPDLISEPLRTPTHIDPSLLTVDLADHPSPLYARLCAASRVPWQPKGRAPRQEADLGQPFPDPACPADVQFPLINLQAGKPWPTVLAPVAFNQRGGMGHQN